MRSVTKQAVKEARLKEIKQELLNSEKLKVCEDEFKKKKVHGQFKRLTPILNAHLFNCSVSIQMYFEDNPRDLQLLRHDKDLHPAIVKPHLRNVPDYLSKTLLI